MVWVRASSAFLVGLMMIQGVVALDATGPLATEVPAGAEPVPVMREGPTKGEGEGFVDICLTFVNIVTACWFEVGSASLQIGTGWMHGNVGAVTLDGSCSADEDEDPYSGHVGGYFFGGECDDLAARASWLVPEVGALCRIHVSMSGTDGISRVSLNGDVVGACT